MNFAASHALPQAEERILPHDGSVVHHSTIAPLMTGSGHVWTGAPGDRRKADGEFRHGEGVASYTGLKSCACGREAASEALTGECVG